jgi:hypothetical protein
LELDFEWIKNVICCMKQAGWMAKSKVVSDYKLKHTNKELVTPDFPKETKCIPICMPGSSFMHIVTNK